MVIRLRLGTGRRYIKINSDENSLLANANIPNTDIKMNVLYDGLQIPFEINVQILRYLLRAHVGKMYNYATFWTWINVPDFRCHVSCVEDTFYVLSMLSLGNFEASSKFIFEYKIGCLNFLSAVRQTYIE